MSDPFTQASQPIQYFDPRMPQINLRNQQARARALRGISDAQLNNKLGVSAGMNAASDPLGMQRAIGAVPRFGVENKPFNPYADPTATDDYVEQSRMTAPFAWSGDSNDPAGNPRNPIHSLPNHIGIGTPEATQGPKDDGTLPPEPPKGPTQTTPPIDSNTPVADRDWRKAMWNTVKNAIVGIPETMTKMGEIENEAGKKMDAIRQSQLAMDQDSQAQAAQKQQNDQNVYGAQPAGYADPKALAAETSKTDLAKQMSGKEWWDTFGKSLQDEGGQVLKGITSTLGNLINVFDPSKTDFFNRLASGLSAAGGITGDQLYTPEDREMINQNAIKLAQGQQEAQKQRELATMGPQAEANIKQASEIAKNTYPYNLGLTQAGVFPQTLPQGDIGNVMRTMMLQKYLPNFSSNPAMMQMLQNYWTNSQGGPGLQGYDMSGYGAPNRFNFGK